MVRLIVDDAGSRRAFNVGEGRLSVGSGPEAKLKLSAPGVASLHVDIEVHGGKATLHPKPGVTAPHLLGRAANGPVVLQHGVPVKIGGATVTVEYEGLPSKLAPAAAPGAAPVGGVQPVVRKSAGRDADEEERGGRRPKKQGTPTWVFIAVGLPVIAVVGWLVSSKLMGGQQQKFAGASAPAFYDKALDRFKNAQYDKAQEQLDLITDDSTMTADLKTKVAKLRDDVKVKVEEGKAYMANEVEAKRYFGSQLDGFVKQYMAGQITPPEARVFMKRARYFREKWPKSPDLPWIDRQEARFKAAIDLTKPPTFDDIAFEIQTLTWSHPRDYKTAFEVAHTFQETAAGSDVQKIAGLLQELETKRADWYKDRLEQARWHFDRKEQSQSIGVLLSIVRGAGDDAMADDAANRLLKYGSAEEMQTWLRGHKNNDPDSFAKVEKNRVIAAFLREHKL